jgi:hypothetical protein
LNKFRDSRKLATTKKPKESKKPKELKKSSEPSQRKTKTAKKKEKPTKKGAGESGELDEPLEIVQVASKDEALPEAPEIVKVGDELRELIERYKDIIS